MTGEAIRVFHPAHRTAWSARTEGYPMFGLASEGIVWESWTSKKARYLDLPSNVKLVAWCYRSNRNHSTVYFLLPKDGLPEVACVSSFDEPSDLRSFLEQQGLLACLERLEDWLWG